MKSETIIEEYFNYHKKYAEIHGKDTTYVLMQKGKFYESYSTPELGPNLSHISKITNVTLSRTNKQIQKIDITNPNFLGFQTISLLKFVEILIEYYTVIIIDQVGQEILSNGKTREKREVTQIYTKGTFIENISIKNTKYIVSIFISEEKQKSGKILLCCGLSAIDLSTSYVYIHESYDESIDTNFALDEAYRFITSLCPSEILIYYRAIKTNLQEPKYDEEYIINYFELDKSICRFYTNIDDKYFKLVWQNELLKKAYPNVKTLIEPIEYLNLDNKIYIIVALTFLLDFIYDKNKSLLSNLSKPLFYLDNKHMILGNNAIYQLNIIDDKSNNNIKYKSLFHVVNNTSTGMGERYLKSMLISPIVSSEELNKTYDLTEELLKKKFWLIIEQYLDSIKDIERLERQISLLTLKPSYLILLMNSYETILNLIAAIFAHKKSVLLKTLLPSEKTIKKINKMIEDIKKTFDIIELEKYSTLEFKTSIFNSAIHEDLDNLKDDVEQGHVFMEILRDKLIEYINVKSNSKNKSINIKNNNRDGYYLVLTKVRAKILKDKLEKIEFIELNDTKFDKKIDKNILQFKDDGKFTKIYFLSLDKKTDDITSYIDQIETLNKKYYIEYLGYFFDKYNSVFKICNSFITKLDYLKSNAKLVSLYNYTRPNIIQKQYSYINAEQLRHPIVERIIDYDYVPHDIEIGHDDLKGMLIYGLNSSGKSVMMKSIGTSIILAQAGLFVPAKTFTFSPYTALYTRITGNDNIFKGLSSFALEMVELNSILKRANENTMVIGDEICRGTEHISGNAIVATTIIKLTKLLSTFIFATHLHEISTLEEITSLSNVKSYHLQVDYDVKTEKLIYNRILSPGSGEPIYGITVARHIIHDLNFIDTANNIKNKLLHKYNSLISNKSSKYNKDVYVHECHVCGKQDSISHISPLETHHINFQKNCTNGFVNDKSHIKQNQQSNLIVLCSKCHDKVHQGKIIINGYIMTSEGKNIVINKK